jgi:hypothetical protein
VTCSLRAAGFPSTVRIKALDGGKIYLYNPGGRRSREDELTQPLIALHKRGRPVTVSGEVVKEFAASLVSQLRQQSNGAFQAGDPVCPATIDLSGTNRGICRVEIMGKSVQIAMWIDGDDWHEETVEIVVPTARIEEIAAEHFRDIEKNNGFLVNVAVHCHWPAVVLMTPPAQRDCRLTVGKSTKRLTIHIPDRSGAIAYYVW